MINNEEQKALEKGHYLIFEVLHDARGGGGAVDEHQTHAAVGVAHAEACEDVGSCTLAQTNHQLHLQEEEDTGLIMEPSVERNKIGSIIKKFRSKCWIKLP